MSGGRPLSVVTALAAALALFLLLPCQSPAAEGWQSSRVFQIDPDEIPGYPPGGSVAKYRLLDASGTPVKTIERPSNNLAEGFAVPPVPGAYKLEAWVVDDAGAELTRTSTIFRFDDVAPSAPTAMAPGGWLQGEEVAMLDLQAPAAPLPLSGLSGYAISLDRGAGGHPCASPTLCTAAETDIPADEATEPVALGVLPQGTTYARVVAVSGAGVPSPVSTAALRVDATAPQLSLSAGSDGWSNRPVLVHAHATDALSGMAAAGPGGAVTAISVDGSAAATTPGDTAAAWVGGSGTHEIDAFARDAAGNVGLDSGGVDSPGSIVRIDEDPPQVAFANAQDPAEPERIEAAVSDRLSGPSASAGSISVRPAGTHARFEELTTRVATGRLIARWDSDSYPAGKYEFLATGYDSAGNSATGTDRAHGGRMFLVNPLKSPASLATELSKRRFGGRLLRVGGGGLAGQRVVVVETFASGAEPAHRTTVQTTGAGGSFALQLQPGPSRDVAAHFAGTSTLTRSSGESAYLGVATGLRLRASSSTAAVGGKPVVFSGGIRAGGAKAAVRGLPVELQFRYPGSGWRSFRTVEADRRGRFRYAYRFSDDDSRSVRFQFRAHVKGREGWPYEPGTSRPVTVTGR
ncbi:MAG TPA: hypothetical protein VFN18_13515 [Solirubrobacterales bacterium]|nr:hypothetical protein [Solirubrobacterales bacterium]